MEDVFRIKHCYHRKTTKKNMVFHLFGQTQRGALPEWDGESTLGCQHVPKNRVEVISEFLVGK